MRALNRAAPLLLILLLSSLSLSAQLVESIEVRITNVDVVVTDARGRTIHGLTGEDFELYEEGKPQTITNFYEVRGAASVLEPAQPVLVAEEARVRRLVLFIDETTLHPLRRTAVLQRVLGSFDRLLRPGDEVMVVRWNRRLHMAQRFTADAGAARRSVETALKRSGGGGFLYAERRRVVSTAAQLRNLAQSGMMSWGDAHREALASARTYADDLEMNVKAMCNGLRQVIGLLGGMEGRKALVLITGDLPRRPGIDLIEAINATFRTMEFGIAETAMTEMRRELGQEIEEVIRSAAGNGVPLYAIDAGERGVSGGPAESVFPVDQAAEFLAESETPAALGEMADATGGRVLARSRNYDLLLRSLAGDLDSYYSLGYRSEMREGIRRIEVRVRRPGARVRTRQFVLHKTTAEERRDAVVSNLFHQHLIGDFPISLQTGTPAIDGRTAMVPVTVSFQPSDLSYLRDGEEMVGEFAVHFVVGTPDGEVSPAVSSVKPVRFPSTAAATIWQKPFTFTATLRVGRGPQIISAAVVDQGGGGTGYATVTVKAPR